MLREGTTVWLGSKTETGNRVDPGEVLAPGSGPWHF